jgi:hypothetical protein
MNVESRISAAGGCEQMRKGQFWRQGAVSKCGKANFGSTAGRKIFPPPDTALRVSLVRSSALDSPSYFDTTDGTEVDLRKTSATELPSLEAPIWVRLSAV